MLAQDGKEKAMSRHPNAISSIDDTERERETAEARADLQRRADAQGVKPFDADEWHAELETKQAPEEVRQEVDEFLGMLREWRDTPSNRSVG
jgi:hypothetical protein